MTRKTNRNNVKPMFRFVTGMMVLFRPCRAITALHRIGANQLARPDSLVNSILCFTKIQVRLIIFSTMLTMTNFIFLCLSIAFLARFTFFRLFITLVSCFAFITFEVFIFAYFTSVMVPVFPVAVFIKLRNWFDLFASGTSFRYDCFSHSLFPYKGLRLELLAEPISVSSSLYYNAYVRDTQTFFKKFSLTTRWCSRLPMTVRVNQSRDTCGTGSYLW